MGTDFAGIANISLALSLLVAVVFGILQFRAAARDRRERLTMDTLRAFQSRDFASKINMIRLSGPPETIDEISERPADEQIEILQLAQEMESLGLMVEEHMIDLDLVEKSLGSFVVDAWKRYAPLMRSGREKDPYLGEYFEWLAVCLEDRMRTQPRVPAHQRLPGRAAS
ncbi:MAG TPA: hypothetical protein VLC06_06415 [Polyangia bacterium]|nr:hypothetical protein [Polyangia bacterium]